jgi:uncharacterized protein
VKVKNVDDKAVFERKKERFECVKCGNCCCVPGYVFLNIKEAQKIAKHMKMDYCEFEKMYIKKFQNQLALKTPVVGGCIFWKDKKCTIYELRPSQCRTFPYWKELTGSHKDWKEIEEYCEGAKKL